MVIWSACICIYHMDAWCPLRSENDVEPCGSVLTYCCELIHGGWESNLGPWSSK